MGGGGTRTGKGGGKMNGRGGEFWLMVPSGAVSKPEPGTKQGYSGKLRRNLDDFSSMCRRLRAVKALSRPLLRPRFRLRDSGPR